MTTTETGYIEKSETMKVALYPNELGILSFRIELIERFELTPGAVGSFKVVDITRTVTERG